MKPLLAAAAVILLSCHPGSSSPAGLRRWGGPAAARGRLPLVSSTRLRRSSSSIGSIGSIYSSRSSSRRGGGGGKLRIASPVVVRSEPDEQRQRAQEMLGIDENKMSQMLTDIVYNTEDIQTTKILTYKRFVSDFLGDDVHDTLTEQQRENVKSWVGKLLRRYDIELDDTVETAARVTTLEINEREFTRRRRDLREKFYIKFTCNTCKCAGISRVSYQGFLNGTVVAACHYCGKLHLLADNVNEMDFEGFKNLADPETQAKLGMKGRIRVIPDSRLLSEEQLAEFGLLRNKTTGKLQTFDQNREKDPNIGFGVWKDHHLRPSQRRQILMAEDWEVRDMERMIALGKSNKEAEEIARERSALRENPRDFIQALLHSNRSSDSLDAIRMTEAVWEETEGGMYDQLSDEYKEMLHQYHDFRLSAGQEEKEDVASSSAGAPVLNLDEKKQEQQ